MSTATATLPLTYRIILTTIEPMLSVLGALINLRDPERYLHSTSYHSDIPYEPHTSFLYTEIGGLWMMLAFNEAVVLRVFDDVRLWRLICAGTLLSDLFYMSSWPAWVKTDAFLRQRGDWILLGLTVPFVLVRISILFGLGFKRSALNGSKQKQ